MSDVGRQIDRYVIEAVLGAGGFGAVYRARHTVLGTQVALKVLSPQRAHDPTTVERFLREAKLAASIGNPHIVSVSDAGIADGKPFLAMEVLSGEDLEARLARGGALPLSAAVDIGLQVLEGLAAAHGAGIVHRDMKPANVFLIPGPDGRPFAKLLDFGISKVVTPGRISQLTQTGMMLGTPAYMAPEQIQNTSGVDASADLYSVAAMLFEMLTGRLPYPAETIGDMVLRLQGTVPERLEVYLPGAPRALADLIAQNLATQKEHRSPDARGFASALRVVRASLVDEPVSVRFAAPPDNVAALLSTGAGTAEPAWRAGQPTPVFGGASGSIGMGLGPMAPPGGSSHGGSSHGGSPHGPSDGGVPANPGSFGHPSTPGGFGQPSTQGSFAHASMPGTSRPMGVQEVAPQEGGRTVWLVLAALLFVIPLTCLGGGVATYLFSEGDPSSTGTPTRPTWSTSPVVIPSPPSTPAAPIRPLAPPPPITPQPPPPPPGTGPLVATPLPEGTGSCEAPVVHEVECDRQSDRHEPSPCTIQRGRELHVVGAYAGGEIALDVARTTAPLVLVLSSYSAATWRLRVAEGVRIEQIVTVGMQTSEVVGAPEGTRVRSVRGSPRGYPIMGWSWQGMGANWSGQRTAEAAESDLNLALRSYVGCYAPRFFRIGQSAP